MRRREFIIALGGIAVWPLAALAQQAASRIVGVLDIGSLEGARRNFGQAQPRLAEMGYVEGRNLALEYRGADSHLDRLAALARDLVQRRVDIIAVFAGPSIVAAKAATTSIPIMFLTGYDPVASGFVASLNRPGGNVTGISVLNTQVFAKRLEVLCELVPTAKSIGYLYVPSPSEGAANALGVKLLPVEARGLGDFEGAFATMANARLGALFLSADAL